MSSAYKLLPHYTYHDYLQWEGKWELIDGIPYAMAPTPIPEHQFVSSNISGEFRSALKKSNCGCKVYQPIDYKISEETVLNPDLLIVCQPIAKNFLDFPPDLVVEILSPSTAMKDRHTKFQLYQQQKIPYYIIVDASNRSVEIYYFNGEQYQLQTLQQSQPFSFEFSHCRFELVFANIWD
jgi:Uma2 family endonuclease